MSSAHRRRPTRKAEVSRGKRLGRRLKKVGKFGYKHRGSALCVVGALGAGMSLLLLEGTVQTLVGVVSIGAVVGGGVIRHHQRTRTLNRNPNVHTPSWRERAAFEDEMRRGNTPPPAAGSGPITVTSHSRDGESVKTYTRARPGEGKAS